MNPIHGKYGMLWKNVDGKMHRDDGPAAIYVNGDKYWFQNGKRHRLDGPAIEWQSGAKQWYYNDEHIFCQSQKEFERLIKLKVFW